MRKPVKTNCNTVNNSTRIATCVHVTNNPSKKQLKTAWLNLANRYDASENIPAIIQQNLMNLTTELISLHQQAGLDISHSTTSATDWLNNLYAFFEELRTN